MPSPAAIRRSTTLRQKGRLSSVFWGLARDSGAETNAADPIGVVRHLLASVAVLQGTSPQPSVSADALTFLLQLEKDPYYASPEQIRGGDKDSQGLVYSIGVLLFERLTGHHPFVESLSPMQCALSRDRSKRVGKNNLCSLPKRLRDMLQRAMSPFPEDRWPDLTSFAKSLEQFVEHHEAEMKPLPWRRGLGSQPELPRLTTTPNTPRSLGIAKTMVTGHAPTQPLRSAPTHVEHVSPAAAAAKPGPRGRRKSSPPPCPGSPERQALDAKNRVAEGSAPKPQPPTPRNEAPRPPTIELSPLVFVPTRVVETPERILDLPSLVPPPVDTGLLNIDLRRRPRVPRLVVVGAAVFAATVLIATTMLGGDHASGAASAAQPARSANAPEMPTPAPATVADVQPDVAKPAAAAPAVTPAAPIPTPTVTSIAPPPFDAKAGGQAALSAIRPCYSSAQLRRGTQLGVSLHYSSKTGKSAHVYFADSKRIPAAQRRCLAHALVGVSAGAPPKRGTIATYTFWLSATTERQRVHRRR